jgi:hypothetical protein
MLEQVDACLSSECVLVPVREWCSCVSYDAAAVELLYCCRVVGRQAGFRLLLECFEVSPSYG